MNASASSEDVRLFLAVTPDVDTAVRIHRLAGVLKRAHQFNGKLIEPARLHVSLFFLGGLPEQDIRAACAAAADVRIEPFELSFDRTASFRGKRGSRPFVLVGDEGLQRLTSFRQMLGGAAKRSAAGGEFEFYAACHTALRRAQCGRVSDRADLLDREGGRAHPQPEGP
jgi:2'-5' RNA ligase